MKLRQLFDKSSSTYSYLLWDEESLDAVIIDSVFEQSERDIKLINELGLYLRYALETHIHADHITGAGLLRERFGCQVGVHQSAEAACADIALKEGDEVRFGHQSLKVLYTPGHTHTDISYLGEGCVFTGDTLLIRGSGRTDFQSGDAGQAYDSITQKLFVLSDDVLVYPAHDYTGQTLTTIGEEKRLNPRLRDHQTREGYVAIMNGLVLDKPAKIDVAVPGNQRCGVHGTEAVINQVGESR
ncbi:MAG: MBL fold metallo-hydrolase [Sedimenticola sp.]|nr:MBL fold metallo-hydrolase [Sedimenticola sp.]